MFFFRWKVTAPVFTFRSCNNVRLVDPRPEKTRTHLDVDLVSAKNNGDVFTDTLEIAMPVGDVLVGDTGGHVKHDDTTLALDIVTVAETAELFLASSVPHVETDSTEVCGEGQGMNLDAQGG